MAGTIFKKLRGLAAKLWTKQQFLLNRGGLWVDNQETEGLLSKNARPNMYGWLGAVGSRFEGQD